MEAYVLDWGDVAEIAIKAKLVEEGPFSLTRKVKEALIHAVEKTDSMNLSGFITQDLNTELQAQTEESGLRSKSQSCIRRCSGPI